MNKLKCEICGKFTSGISAQIIQMQDTTVVLCQNCRIYNSQIEEWKHYQLSETDGECDCCGTNYPAGKLWIVPGEEDYFRKSTRCIVRWFLFLNSLIIIPEPTYNPPALYIPGW